MSPSELKRHVEPLNQCCAFAGDEDEQESARTLRWSVLLDSARAISQQEIWRSAPAEVTMALANAVRFACRAVFAGTQQAESFLHQIEVLIYKLPPEWTVPVYVAMLGAGFLGKYTVDAEQKIQAIDALAGVHRRDGLGNGAIVRETIDAIISMGRSVTMPALEAALSVSSEISRGDSVRLPAERAEAWNAAKALVLQAEHHEISLPAVVFDVLTEMFKFAEGRPFSVDAVDLFIRSGPACVPTVADILDNCDYHPEYYQAAEVLAHFDTPEAIGVLIDYVDLVDASDPTLLGWRSATWALSRAKESRAMRTLVRVWVRVYGRECEWIDSDWVLRCGHEIVDMLAEMSTAYDVGDRRLEIAAIAERHREDARAQSILKRLEETAAQ
jgi:hypothetical protein